MQGLERRGAMEYISSFTYCDTIQTEMTPQGTKHQIVNPLQVLAPVAIPGNYSFSIACNIAGFDTGKENCIKIIFCDPQEQVLYDTGEVKFQVENQEQGLDNIPGIQFNIEIRNLVFKETGIYTTKIYFNNKQLGEYKIQVIKGECR